MKKLEEIGNIAKETSYQLMLLSQNDKNRGLLACANALINNQDTILAANEKDMINAKEKGTKTSMLDRLLLNTSRIQGMANGLREIAELEDPIGEVIGMKERPNGLVIGQKRVPLGVIGIIYEARPNVTVDAFGLCFKTGNSVILRGGSEAIESNKAIVGILQIALREVQLPELAVQLIEDLSRETAKEFMRLNEYIDVLIPRGGAGLIKTVLQNSTIPVIETGTGNCHIFVDASAKISDAIEIIDNAKTQRPGVCNSCETVLVHEEIVANFLPKLIERLQEKQVEIHGDLIVKSYGSNIILATNEDWQTEYLDMIIAIKVVKDIEEAIAHINKYNTKHSEAILTSDYGNANKFLREVDAAAVYVNASTRFTDGFEFGYGAEIGISTQKLHARGPMGLKELTTTKYIIYGDGQIRL